MTVMSCHWDDLMKLGYTVTGLTRERLDSCCCNTLRLQSWPGPIDSMAVAWHHSTPLTGHRHHMRSVLHADADGVHHVAIDLVTGQHCSTTAYSVASWHLHTTTTNMYVATATHCQQFQAMQIGSTKTLQCYEPVNKHRTLVIVQHCCRPLSVHARHIVCNSQQSSHKARCGSACQSACITAAIAATAVWLPPVEGTPTYAAFSYRQPSPKCHTLHIVTSTYPADCGQASSASGIYT